MYQPGFFSGIDVANEMKPYATNPGYFYDELNAATINKVANEIADITCVIGKWEDSKQ